MKPLDQSRSIEADKPNRTVKVRNKSISQGSILEKLIDFAESLPDFRRTVKGNIRHRHADIIMLLILTRASGHVGCADLITRVRE